MSAKRLEDSARTALETGAGRSLTDAEWARARDMLLEFVNILREWDPTAHQAESDLANV
jgi:hypothetical protein